MTYTWLKTFPFFPLFEANSSAMGLLAMLFSLSAVLNVAVCNVITSNSPNIARYHEVHFQSHSKLYPYYYEHYNMAHPSCTHSHSSLHTPSWLHFLTPLLLPTCPLFLSLSVSGWSLVLPCIPPQLNRLCLYSKLLPNKRHGTISPKLSARTWICGANKQRLVHFDFILLSTWFGNNMEEPGKLEFFRFYLMPVLYCFVDS